MDGSLRHDIRRTQPPEHPGWVRPTVIWTTALIFLPALIYVCLVFDGWPPLPMTLCILLSHGVFCLIIASVRPYRGPYRDPDHGDPFPGP